MSHRILLVDDEVDILEFVRYNLVREGYEVYTAQNGAEALQRAAACRPHLILLADDTPAAPDSAQTGITVDRERHTVLCDGREITLPRKEFALLELLCAAPGRLVSREEIYARIWGSEVVVGDRTIDVHIRKLRQKIGERRIVTVKGMGYKYEP